MFATSRLASIPALFAAGLVGIACGSSTSTVTAPSTITRCGVTLGATDATLPAEGGSGRITVTTARECAWSASSEAPWLSITSANSGQGDGAIEYRVASNADPLARRGAIVLNDRRAEIAQAAGTCILQLRQPSAGFGQGGGSGSVEVIASSQLCTWTATTDSNWITLTSSTNGKGSASVAFSIAPTTGPPRTGTISIADQRFSVTQSEGCVYAISPQQQSFGAQGGPGTIAISTAAGCPWTSLSNVPWITVAQGAEGAGPGSVSFSVAATAGPPRTGTLVVAGHSFAVTQSSGCAYQVAPLSHAAPPAGATLSVTVDAPPGCGWAAQSNSEWIALVGMGSGAGGATVSFTVAASSGPSRNGSLTVAGQTVTVNQGAGCTFTIAPESQAIPASGGSGSVAVTAPQGCAWTAASHADWITIPQASTSGTGNGTVQFNVAATTGGARSGTMTIAGRTFTVNQSESCSFTFVPENVTIGASGGNTSFGVQTGTACAWTAVVSPSSPWITINGPASSTGPGNVQLNVAPNTVAPRTGTVTVGGRAFIVNQESGCSFTLSAQSYNAPAAGGPGSVDVAGDPACEWMAASNQPWIAITSPVRGTGNATIAFNVAQNVGPARSGQLTIGSRVFTINQADGCAFAIAPQQQSVPVTGGDVFVNVTGAGGCAWTTQPPSVSWLSVVGATGSGTGNGTVQLSVTANTDAARSGTVNIAGLTFTADQASGCTYGISPPSRTADAAGGNNSFNVTTSGAGCPWKAEPDVPWITITQGSTGVGTNKVDYLVLPNPGPARSGTITVQGQVFTVTQSGM